MAITVNQLGPFLEVAVLGPRQRPGMYQGLIPKAIIGRLPISLARLTMGRRTVFAVWG